MFKKIMSLLTPSRKIKMEVIPTMDKRITDQMNKHAVYQWHGDCYVDLNGNTYEVKRKTYPTKAELKKENILNSPDID